VCLAFRKASLLATIRAQAAGADVLSGKVTYRNRELVRPLTQHEFMIDIDLYESLGPIAYARSHLQRHFRPLFFEKLQDWRDEAEWRVVVLGSAAGPIDISYGDAHVGVVLGADLDEKLSWTITDMTEGTSVQHMGLVWKNSNPWYNYEAMRWSQSDRRSPWERRPQ
jgi:hypothetical protein